MSDELLPRTEGEISIARQVQEHLSGMFNIVTLGETLVRNEFDLNEEVQLLIDIIRDDAASPSDRLRARKDLRTLLQETMMLNGMIGKTTIRNQHTMEDGTVQVQQAQGDTLLTRMRNQNESEFQSFAGARAHLPQEKKYDGTEPTSRQGPTLPKVIDPADDADP